MLILFTAAALIPYRCDKIRICDGGVQMSFRKGNFFRRIVKPCITDGPVSTEFIPKDATMACKLKSDSWVGFSGNCRGTARSRTNYCLRHILSNQSAVQIVFTTPDCKLLVVRVNSSSLGVIEINAMQWGIDRWHCPNLCISLSGDHHKQ